MTKPKIIQKHKIDFCAEMQKLNEQEREITRQKKELRQEMLKLCPICVDDVIEVLPATEKMLRDDARWPKDGYKKAWVASVTVFDDGEFGIRINPPKKDGSRSKLNVPLYAEDWMSNIIIVETNAKDIL